MRPTTKTLALIVVILGVALLLLQSRFGARVNQFFSLKSPIRSPEAIAVGNLSGTINEDPIQLAPGEVDRMRTSGQTQMLRKPTEKELKLLERASTEVDRFMWNVSNASRQPQEVRHIIFIKVHKAASTTLYNLFLRFSASRQLYLLLPHYPSNLLSIYGTRMARLLAHPPSPPFLFDMLANHAVFNHSQFRPMFPSDTQYVAIVRDPWQLVLSSYTYFTIVEPFQYLRKAGSFEHFIKHQSLYEPPSAYFSFTNNRMSIDLGLHPSHVKNSSYIGTFLGQIDSIFDVVLVVERMDESLVLMKRLFHWTLKDIVYQKLNSVAHKRKTTMQPDAQLLERFRQFEQFDMALYEHSLLNLDKKVAMQTPDFHEEVEAFQHINNNISNFCSQNLEHSKPLVVSATKWSAEFTVDPKECRILSAREMAVNSWAQIKQLKRLAPLLFEKQYLTEAGL